MPVPKSRRDRNKLRSLVESRQFQATIIGLIIVNAVILGLETFPGVMAQWGGLLSTVNTAIVAIFVIEVTLRIYAHGRSFFTDGWNLFDLFVVIIALIPANGGSAVLRILRILRVLRLLSTVKSMRMVIQALGAAIPGMISIGGLLVMMIYMFAVSSTTLFATAAPEFFGNLYRSTTSLFRLMISDGWPDIVKPLASEQPWVWAYFIAFAVVTTFIVLNLFVAVTVEAMNRESQKLKVRAEASELRAQLNRIEAQLTQLQMGASSPRQQDQIKD